MGRDGRRVARFVSLERPTEVIEMTGERERERERERESHLPPHLIMACDISSTLVGSTLASVAGSESNST